MFKVFASNQPAFDSQPSTFNCLMPPTDLLAGLPSEELVREGLADLEAERRTIPACLALAPKSTAQFKLIVGV